MATPIDVPLPLAIPSGVTLRSKVARLVRLRRNTSSKGPLLSFVVRLLAWLEKIAKFPSALSTGAVESELALAEAGAVSEGVVTSSPAAARLIESKRSEAQSVPPSVARRNVSMDRLWQFE